eukprot:CAMPEP_0197048984 /NCGR_PEP_ID=MMETSP1384-20130603/24235_1 /TAXON_ID=29189 /ORGANISM="Ammonia sp." /LENGTH=407 /DNA_ID=CAMNT_0042481203 /DNA_START=108 /DNA_END=1331 /DNA_ORIENTATION=-
MNTAIGVFFGIFAEFFGSSGNIQIKYSHKLEEQKSLSAQIPLFQRTRFRIACILYAINGVCNLISCIFASLNVLAPTSSFTIVLNAALAHFYFGEKLTKYGYLASFMIMIGSTISVIYGHSEKKTSFDLDELTSMVINATSIFFAISHWFVIALCILIGKALSKQFELETRIVFTQSGTPNQANDREFQSSFDQLSQSTVDNDDVMESIRALTNKFCQNGNTQYAIRAFCYSFATGSIASWVQFFGKAVGVLISESVKGDPQFSKMGSWLYMLFALWFIYWMMVLLSEMMRLFDAVMIVPLYETFIIFNMILLDAVYFGREETVHEAASHKMWFWCGILICIIGMFVLTMTQKNAVRNYQEHDEIEVDVIHDKHAEIEPLIPKHQQNTDITLHDYKSTGMQQKYDVV